MNDAEDLKDSLEYQLKQALREATPEQEQAINEIFALTDGLTATQALILSNALLTVASIKEPAFRRFLQQ